MKSNWLLLLLIILSFSVHAQSEKAGGVHRKSYGRNSLLVTGSFNIVGPGPGLQYERSLTANHKWSLVAPVYLSYAKVPPGHNGHFTTGESGETKTAVMVFFEPGICFYPAGCSGVVRYSAERYRQLQRQRKYSVGKTGNRCWLSLVKLRLSQHLPVVI